MFDGLMLPFADGLFGMRMSSTSGVSAMMYSFNDKWWHVFKQIGLNFPSYVHV